jgi:hypothetical protein
MQTTIFVDGDEEKEEILGEYGDLNISRRKYSFQDIRSKIPYYHVEVVPSESVSGTGINLYQVSESFRNSRLIYSLEKLKKLVLLQVLVTPSIRLK